MQIFPKRRNSEIMPFHTEEYISSLYFIPINISNKCRKVIKRISKLLQYHRFIEIIESDLFMVVIIDASHLWYAFCWSWSKRSIYLGYEPSLRYVHATSICIKGMKGKGKYL